MVDHESDGVNEALQSAVRVAITVGGLMAERIVRAREQAMRDAQAQSEQDARELQVRMDAERGVARASLAPLSRDDWWERAGPEEIGIAWETANAWRDIDRDAANTVDHMRDQLRGRYEIDPDNLGADPGAVQEALERRERALRLSAQTRQQARLDEAVAAPLLMSAAAITDRDQARQQAERDHDPADEQRAAALYDSADSRHDAANTLEGVVDDETIEARVVADTSQAHPAHDAIASSPTRTPTARRARGKGSQVRSPARRPDRGR